MGRSSAEESVDDGEGGDIGDCAGDDACCCMREMAVCRLREPSAGAGIEEKWLWGRGGSALEDPLCKFEFRDCVPELTALPI